MMLIFTVAEPVGLYPTFYFIFSFAVDTACLTLYIKDVLVLRADEEDGINDFLRTCSSGATIPKCEARSSMAVC